jgi:PPOX class probable F420-dependent enzyme
MPAAVSGDQEEAVEGGYFAPLASAKYMLLTTSKPDGSQASDVVRGVVIGDRAYVQARSHSDAVQNLRHRDKVQVAPCAARGLLLLAASLDAVARLLPDEEASQVAAKLARTSQVQRHLSIPLLHRVNRARRQQMVHYELLACESAAVATHDRGALDNQDRSAADPPGKEPGAHHVTVTWSSTPFPWPP